MSMKHEKIFVTRYNKKVGKVFRVVIEFEKEGKYFYFFDLVNVNSKEDINISNLYSNKFIGINTGFCATIDDIIEREYKLIGIYDVIERGCYDENGVYTEIKDYIAKKYSNC